MSLLLHLNATGCHVIKSPDSEQAIHRFGYSWGADTGVETTMAWQRDRVEIATDHIGCYPVYIAKTPTGTFLGTDAWETARAAGLTEIDFEAAICLLAFEHVPGAQTLIKGLYQLPAAHQITFVLNGEQWRRESKRTWRYTRRDVRTSNVAQLRKQASDNLRSLIEPILKKAGSDVGGIALNLSGGWDSRALLACLLPAKPHRLQACTYGDPRSSGVRAARRSAQAVDVPLRYYPFESGSHLRDWHLQLCAMQPPVCRFNLSDGGYAIASNYYGDASATVTGHSGDAFTGLPAGSHALKSADDLIAYLRKSTRTTFATSLFQLLQIQHRALAKGPDDQVTALASAAFSPGAAGPIRFKLEQRVRRLVVPELQVLLRYTHIVYTPMLERPFIDFWAAVPDEELENQTAYRQMIAEHLFVGSAEPLRFVPREGGGLITRTSPTAARARNANKRLLHAAQRVLPGAVGRRIVTDPTAAWWYSDAALRDWAIDTIRQSITLQNLFQMEELEKLLRHIPRTQMSLAQTGVWSLLTIAGVETLLKN